MISTELGKIIAKLINDRECADIMIESLLTPTTFDLERVTHYQEQHKKATTALRELNIPVTD